MQDRCPMCRGKEPWCGMDLYVPCAADQPMRCITSPQGQRVGGTGVQILLHCVWNVTKRCMEQGLVFVKNEGTALDPVIIVMQVNKIGCHSDGLRWQSQLNNSTHTTSAD